MICKCCCFHYFQAQQPSHEQLLIVHTVSEETLSEPLEPMDDIFLDSPSPSLPSMQSPTPSPSQSAGSQSSVPSSSQSVSSHPSRPSSSALETPSMKRKRKRTEAPDQTKPTVLHEAMSLLKSCASEPVHADIPYACGIMVQNFLRRYPEEHHVEMTMRLTCLLREIEEDIKNKNKE